MKYVLDSSVGIKIALPERDSDKAADLRDAMVKGIHELHAPDIFAVEISHGLVRASRRGIIAEADVPRKVFDILSNSPALHPYLSLLTRAVEIALGARMGVYDCLYVALAEREQCELVTADARLASTLQGQFSVVLLADFPG